MPPVFRYAFGSMGCPCEIHLDGIDGESARSIAAAARAEVDRLDRKFSHYRDDSLVAAMAACADDATRLQVDEETSNLLDFADALHRQSEGRFDITAGALTKLWDPQHGRVPSVDEIAATCERVGWNRVDWQRPTLRFRVSGMRIDFGGIVKEYAADRAAAICRERGARHGVVDLGGDLAVIGPHADGTPWSIGIKTPHQTDRAISQIALAHGGLATSGDYERALVVDGVRYSHIVDPHSGRPVRSFASVSVVADTCLIAGAASTLAMLLGVEAGRAWLEESGLRYLCVDPDGRVVRDGTALT